VRRSFSWVALFILGLGGLTGCGSTAEPIRFTENVESILGNTEIVEWVKAGKQLIIDNRVVPPFSRTDPLFIDLYVRGSNSNFLLYSGLLSQIRVYPGNAGDIQRISVTPKKKFTLVEVQDIYAKLYEAAKGRAYSKLDQKSYMAMNTELARAYRGIGARFQGGTTLVLADTRTCVAAAFAGYDGGKVPITFYTSRCEPEGG
jgi:hypothetical protein